jgi:hypothetical protein
MQPRLLAATALVALAACSTDPISGPGAPSRLQVVSGGTDAAGRVILESADRFDTVVVRVTDAGGFVVPNVAVTWTTDDPDAVVTPIAPSSDADGLVRAEWRLSGAPGTWKARATAGTLGAAEASFTVTSWSVKNAVVVLGTTCVQSHDDKLWCRESDTTPFTARLGGGTIRALDASASSIASFRRICVIDASGVIRCTVLDTAPLDFVAVPGQSTPFTTLAMAGSGGTNCALDDGGGAWCWGEGFGGLLGDGVSGPGIRAAVAPIAAPGGTRFIDIAIDNENGCALADDGVPWCWGRASYGVLGPAGGPSSSTPRAVVLPEDLISVETTLGGGTACGMTADRQVVCWGNGIGDGTLAPDGAPRILAGAGDAITFSPMPDGFLAIRTKGELMGWGNFYWGHAEGPGAPGSLPRGTAIRARGLYRGLSLTGRTCIDDAAGKGTVCAPTRDLVPTTQSAVPLLWTGFVKPAGAN